MRKRKHSRKQTNRRSRITHYQPGKRRKTFVRFAMALVGLMAISLIFQGYNSRATAGQPRASSSGTSQAQSKSEQKENPLKLKSIRVVPSQDAKASEKDKASLVR